ncbi:IS66 family insertion sequence element accessory protein TnpB [Burkholderia sp. Ax-1719]|uniref:IS66 family insertion sequence element accessory protein TnpB n=1 Tax=Burkholderia sp. Ax-1719 TaxID=2608334 RepID=UPI001420C5CB
MTQEKRTVENTAALLIQLQPEEHPFFGHVFVFRDNRDDLLKVPWWRGHGMCMPMKRL